MRLPPHESHEGRGTVLWDGCEACIYIATEFLEELDDEGLQWLADQAAALKCQFDHPSTHDLSLNERRAISRLRLYARIVFKSGMSEEVAR